MLYYSKITLAYPFLYVMLVVRRRQIDEMKLNGRKIARHYEIAQIDMRSTIERTNLNKCEKDVSYLASYVGTGSPIVPLLGRTLLIVLLLVCLLKCRKRYPLFLTFH